MLSLTKNEISHIPRPHIEGQFERYISITICCQIWWIFQTSPHCIHSPNISRLFPQLQELNVKGNNLKTLVDLYDLQSLLSLTAAENPYVCNMSLCWLRMLPWMKPYITMLQDNLLCDQPTSRAGEDMVHVHPIQMGCYDGMYCIKT